jgi:hypothetical protein
MGKPIRPIKLPELHDLTRESGVACSTAPPKRLAHAHGCYHSIHPALPWYFHALFSSITQKKQ